MSKLAKTLISLTLSLCLLAGCGNTTDQTEVNEQTSQEQEQTQVQEQTQEQEQETQDSSNTSDETEVDTNTQTKDPSVDSETTDTIIEYNETSDIIHTDGDTVSGITGYITDQSLLEDMHMVDSLRYTEMYVPTEYYENSIDIFTYMLAAMSFTGENEEITDDESEALHQILNKAVIVEDFGVFGMILGEEMTSLSAASCENTMGLDVNSITTDSIIEITESIISNNTDAVVNSAGQGEWETLGEVFRNDEKVVFRIKVPTTVDEFGESVVGESEGYLAATVKDGYAAFCVIYFDSAIGCDWAETFINSFKINPEIVGVTEEDLANPFEINSLFGDTMVDETSDTGVAE